METSRRSARLPSYTDVIGALTALPWLIAQVLILAFCGWCIYIYMTKDQGSAVDIALFVFVTAIVCTVQQFVHILLLLTVRCDGKCDRRKLKVDEDSGVDEDDPDEERAQRERLVQAASAAVDGKSSHSSTSSLSTANGAKAPVKVFIGVLLGMSAAVVTVFLGWMVYGCTLVFKQSIRYYRGCVLGARCRLLARQ
jgi:hypothetical protein